MPGFGQEFLTAINEAICDDPERVITELDLPWEVKNGRVTNFCCVHNGDKLGAFTWYLDGNSLRGNWICASHGCEKIFVNTSIGLIRGILSGRHFNWAKSGDRTVSFREVVTFLARLYNISGAGTSASEEDAEKKGLPATSYNLVELVTRKRHLAIRGRSISKGANLLQITF